MTTITTATKAPEAIDVHVIKAPGTLLKERSVRGGAGQTPRPEEIRNVPGDPITRPWRYSNLDHLVDVGMVELVKVPLDDSSLPARTYAAPEEPVPLSPHRAPSRGPSTLRELIDALEAEGVTVTGADHYRELLSVRDNRIPAPSSALALTPRELVEHAQFVATRAAAQGFLGGPLTELHKQVDREQRALMATEADDYLDQLRPAWNTAVAEVRAVRDLGVPADVTPEKLVNLDPEKIGAWVALRDSAALPTLERITGLRIALAEVLGIAEGGDAEHHAYGITNPPRPTLTYRPRRGPRPPVVPPLQKWLEAAYQLDLVPVRDFTTDQSITAGGHDLGRLRIVAQSIHNHTTTDQEA